jgi:putative transcriptional regulator
MATSLSSIPAESSLAGQLLVAMPQMADPRFARSVVYLCAHSADGAMGLVVNRLIDSLTFRSLLEQIGVEQAIEGDDMPVHFGGPVESSRGFVLHTADYVQDSTLVIEDDIALTATIDVLKAIARGKGPQRRVLALGYAGWGAGQLDAEIQANGWLLVPADAELVFGVDNDTKWARAIAKIGIDLTLLSSEAGHA